MFNKRLIKRLAALERQVKSMQYENEIVRCHSSASMQPVFDTFKLKTVVNLILSHLRLDINKTEQINSRTELKKIKEKN